MHFKQCTDDLFDDPRFINLSGIQSSIYAVPISTKLY